MGGASPGMMKAGATDEKADPSAGAGLRTERRETGDSRSRLGPADMPKVYPDESLSGAGHPLWVLGTPFLHRYMVRYDGSMLGASGWVVQGLCERRYMGPDALQALAPSMAGAPR